MYARAVNHATREPAEGAGAKLPPCIDGLREWRHDRKFKSWQKRYPFACALWTVFETLDFEPQSQGLPLPPQVHAAMTRSGSGCLFLPHIRAYTEPFAAIVHARLPTLAFVLWGAWTDPAHLNRLIRQIQSRRAPPLVSRTTRPTDEPIPDPEARTVS
jgi:hypothetical protein